MSSRVFRKLQGDSLSNLPENSDNDEEDDIPVNTNKKRNIFNPFDLVSVKLSPFLCSE